MIMLRNVFFCRKCTYTLTGLFVASVHTAICTITDLVLQIDAFHQKYLELAFEIWYIHTYIQLLRVRRCFLFEEILLVDPTVGAFRRNSQNYL